MNQWNPKAKRVSPIIGTHVRRGDDRQRLRREWICGFGLALAEMHRRLLGGNDSTGVCEVVRNAGLTLAKFKRAGLDDFDLKELRQAGVR